MPRSNNGMESAQTACPCRSNSIEPSCYIAGEKLDQPAHKGALKSAHQASWLHGSWTPSDRCDPTNMPKLPAQPPLVMECMCKLRHDSECSGNSHQQWGTGQARSPPQRIEPGCPAQHPACNRPQKGLSPAAENLDDAREVRGKRLEISDL